MGFLNLFLYVLLLFPFLHAQNPSGPAAPATPPDPPAPPPPTRPPITKFPRQAPFCVMDDSEPDLRNFKEIFEYHNKNPEKFVPVSPDVAHSPTGYIRNMTLNRIYISTKAYSDMHDDHPYREFRNYFHISIITTDDAEGLEGLYVQAISAPLGIPFGEFVTDFDCGDCAEHKTSTLENEIALIPCQFNPAASFLQPNIISIGGKAVTPTKFHEAHFHFRYVDYPCFDVVYAQFLIIAVRQFNSPLQYEVFYSPVYKVGIEGVGAPWPMYYGLKPNEIQCHHQVHSFMNNWDPQKNQKAKVKYSDLFDECTYNENDKKTVGPGNVCPPGPVTCAGKSRDDIPNTAKQWAAFREDYNVGNNAQIGTSIICMDCGEWEDRIGPGTWYRPPIVTDLEEVTSQEIVITQKPIILNFTTFGTYKCDEGTEARDMYAKDEDGNRDPDKESCPNSFEQEVATRGFHWGQHFVLLAHNALLLFTWTVGSNCLIYSGRFMKEASFVEKGSGCFGVGKWIWEHTFLTYLCFTTLLGGIFLVVFADLQALCMFYDSAKDTRECNESSVFHKILGSMASIIFLMGFITGWIRPKTRTLRNFVIYYHVGSGYLAKYLGLFCLLTVRQLLGTTGVVFIILLEVSFIGFFVAGTVIQYMMDKQMKFRVRERKLFPVPEGIDTFTEPPLKNARLLIFPFMIVIQLVLYGCAAFSIWEEDVLSRF